MLSFFLSFFRSTFFTEGTAKRNKRVEYNKDTIIQSRVTCADPESFVRGGPT